MVTKYSKFNVYAFKQNPAENARYLTDLHIRYLPQQNNLLLGTLVPPSRTFNIGLRLQPIMRNHRYKTWLMYRQNIDWLLDYSNAILQEYKVRFGKKHNSCDLFSRIAGELNSIIDLVGNTDSNIATPPPLLSRQYHFKYSRYVRPEILIRNNAVTKDTIDDFVDSPTYTVFGTIRLPTRRPVRVNLLTDNLIIRTSTIDELWTAIGTSYIKIYNDVKIKPNSTWSNSLDKPKLFQDQAFIDYEFSKLYDSAYIDTRVINMKEKLSVIRATPHFTQEGI